tara:strand:- start:46 stop:450 length:405 start_codon:yes stop_codon:yes gene_type:complete
MNNTKQEQKSTQTMSICSISKNPQTVEYFLSEQRTWECLIHQSIRRPELTSTIYQQLRYNEEPTGRTLLSTLFAERHISFNSHPSAFSFVRPVIPDRAMYAAMVVPERYNVRRPVKTDLEIDLSGKLAMVGAVG